MTVQPPPPPFPPPSGGTPAYRVVSQDQSWTATKIISIVVAIITAGYMLPWMIATIRDVPHWLVFWINLLLGWTIIGWIVALVLSLRSRRQVIVPS